MANYIVRKLSEGLAIALLLSSTVSALAQTATATLSDGQIDNLVQRSYQYVAMYNVNNKFAMKQGGWNTCVGNTELADHTMREIARPNNDTLYISCLYDLRDNAMVLELPPFDSQYVSLMITGYDHYVSIPVSTRQGDFSKPEKMLIYSARTDDYNGEPVNGIDRIFEATGDFVSVVFRVMPHASDPERFQRITQQMQAIKPVTLSEHLGGKAKPVSDVQFPDIGKTDADIFGNNLVEVMQFVFNHTTFDPEVEMDRDILAAWEPLGVVPDKAFDPATAAKIDGQRFREKALSVQREWLGLLGDPELSARINPRIFQPKGIVDLEAVLVVSIVGPIGLPQEEAVYPQLSTVDGNPVNAMYDYVIRMSKDELPPANAFWSLTLYDLDQGFFLPNDSKKYSVGQNGGMKLNEDGGIDIYISAEKPNGVPVENWLPITREDLMLSMQMRLYAPDLERLKSWTAPRAEKLQD
jgi:hypothetical protein